MIRIFAIGKVRQSFVRSGMDEYLKRLTKYAKVEYKEVNSFGKLKGFVIALDENGKNFTSEKFASFIKKNTMDNKDVTFVIGEAEGLPKDVVKNADAVISLSSMTFPTQLVRLVFLEQLYRAFTIVKGEKYHK
tara:strand:+ start:967 stop:1365 length:399 start_codon:yes stop_codon:yes gene_type:complete